MRSCIGVALSVLVAACASSREEDVDRTGARVVGGIDTSADGGQVAAGGTTVGAPAIAPSAAATIRCATEVNGGRPTGGGTNLRPYQEPDVPVTRVADRGDHAERVRLNSTGLRTFLWSEDQVTWTFDPVLTHFASDADGTYGAWIQVGTTSMRVSATLDGTGALALDAFTATDTTYHRTCCNGSSPVLPVEDVLPGIAIETQAVSLCGP